VGRAESGHDVEIWFKENPKTNDTKFEENLLDLVTDSTLLCSSLFRSN
jgi:hypothetical protein